MVVKFNGAQCQHYMSEEAYWNAIDDSESRTIKQAEDASKCLLHHGCRYLGRMVVVGAECTPACKHYEYNNSMNHQYAGYLENSLGLDIELIFCGNCSTYFGVQSAHLESCDTLICVFCGEEREIGDVPVGDIVMVSTDEFDKIKEAMESIVEGR